MSTIKRRRRGLYSKEQLIEAVRAIQGKKMTSVKAAQVYQVPESTIRCHTSNSSLRFGAGRSFYLSNKQENYLIELIKSFETIGIRITRVILREMVGQYIKLVTNDRRLKRIVNFTKQIMFNFLLFLEDKPSLH